MTSEDTPVEMRERPRIPPKPNNLWRPPHTTLLSSDSPAPTMSSSSAQALLNKAAATPRTLTMDKTESASPPLPPPVGSPRKRVVKDFDFGESLGEGSYSTVVEATERATGRVYAAKILDKRHIIKEKKIKYVNIERDILQALRHPFVVRLHYAFQDQQSLYFILDLAANGELLGWIRRLGGLSDECARFYLAEIILVTEYMHSENTLHRDLKPENILLGDDMHILVTDFGTAKRFSKNQGDEANKPQRAHSFVGTAEYVSPELLTDKAADRNSDLWAIGCIAYQLLVGRPPFKGPNEYQTFQKILKLEYDFPPWMSPQAKDLIERILALEPGRRLGSTQTGGLAELKSHPFFDGLDWLGLGKGSPPTMTGRASGPPPSLPPKPTVLQQSHPSTSNYYEEARNSSSDEKTSDSSFPMSSTSSSSTRSGGASGGLGEPPLSASSDQQQQQQQLQSYRLQPMSPQEAPVYTSAHFTRSSPPISHQPYMANHSVPQASVYYSTSNTTKVRTVGEKLKSILCCY